MASDSFSAAYVVQRLFPEVETAATIALFGTGERKVIEKLISEKNGRAVIRCLVRQKDVPAKREEIVRQLWLHRLLTQYRYPRERLTVEYPVTFGRDTSKRADIVVFDADRATIPYILIEVKEPKEKDGKEQLRSYCHATGAPLALWSNGVVHVRWHRKNPNYFVEIPALPDVTQTIHDVADQPWTIDTLVEKEKLREKEGLAARSLKQRILDMENEVLANAGVDVFEEVFKLIFTKLYDELSCYRGDYPHIRFRNTNTAAQLKVAIQKLFDEAKTKWEGVFTLDEKIRLNPDHLAVCVGSLEEYKLFNSNLDIVDDAFEYLVNKSSKGEKGQYFTPRWVIDLCVRMLNPREDETLIDTACGSAGFTMHAIFKVWQDILRDEKVWPLRTSSRSKRNPAAASATSRTRSSPSTSTRNPCASPAASTSSPATVRPTSFTSTRSTTPATLPLQRSVENAEHYYRDPQYRAGLDKVLTTEAAAV